MANERSKTHCGLPYHEIAVDFASVAAEATSADVDVALPLEFKFGRPVLCGLYSDVAELDDNAVLLGPHTYWDETDQRLHAIVRLHNANAAGGAAIDAAEKVFWFVQL